MVAWEPSAAQVTKTNSRPLSALKRFYRETRFSAEFTNNNLRQIGLGLPAL